jgi:hypothetical protein
MAPERELLLEIRNEQIAHSQRLERIERRLGLLGRRRELERQLAEERAERAARRERGSRKVARLRREAQAAPAPSHANGVPTAAPTDGACHDVAAEA